MKRPTHTLTTDRMMILLLVVINTIIIKTGFTEDPSWYRVLLVTIPLLLIVIFDFVQKQAP